VLGRITDEADSSPGFLRDPDECDEILGRTEGRLVEDEHGARINERAVPMLEVPRKD